MLSAGSQAYGFWYRLDSNPEGPSFTTSICPKYSPLGAFRNNVAHSNTFYGLRVHPEYYPLARPCSNWDWAQVPAVFDGLVAYRCGVKGAVMTQVSGMVVLNNTIAADNGAGPLQHIVNGKDTGKLRLLS